MVRATGVAEGDSLAELGPSELHEARARPESGNKGSRRFTHGILALASRTDHGGASRAAAAPLLGGANERAQGHGRIPRPAGLLLGGRLGVNPPWPANVTEVVALIHPLLGRWTWRVGVILRPQQIDSSCWCPCHGLEPTTRQPMLVHALKVPRSDRDLTGGSSAQAEISFLAGGRCGAGRRQGDEMEVVPGSQREVFGLAFRDIEQEHILVPCLVEAFVDVERGTGDVAEQHIASPMTNSPSGKHMGVLPAQQPPDCTNITGPPRAARRRVIASRAAGVAVMRAGITDSDITCL